ncbi:MAG: DinB family protein [Ferruginibacter sp.]
MDSITLQSEIDGTISELLEILSSFTKEQFNIVPFEDSWTAGELAQHLLMSGSGFLQMINGPSKDTERSADEFAGKIKSTFLNFNTKMKSPEFIVPPKKQYDKDELVHTLKDVWIGLDHPIQTSDLSKTCTSFELPGFGLLTRYEAVTFVLYHTQRHIQQLKNIRQKIMEPADQ